MERREWHCVEDAEVLVQHPAVCVIVFYEEEEEEVYTRPLPLTSCQESRLGLDYRSCTVVILFINFMVV